METAAPAEQVSFLPSGFSFGPIETDGASLPGTSVTINHATDRYFPAAKIPIIRGREFAAVAPGEDSAIISRNLADRLWPSGAAVGRRPSDAWNCPRYRLCRRFRRLVEHKPGQVVAVAVGRELVGFLWAALHPETA